MKNLHSIGTATVDESFFHPNHDSLTGRGECTCRVGSGSKSKDDRGNEFHGSEGLFCCGCWCGRCWIFMGDTVIDARLVEVFRSQYIFALRQQT